MQNQQGVPNVVGNRAGWYPRWWLLAALCWSIVMIGGMLLWSSVICPPELHQGRPSVCGVTSLYSPLQVLLAWLILVAIWFPIPIFAVPLVEVPRRDRNPIGEFLRRITQFAALYPMLLLQAGVAFVIINIMWWINNTPPAAFAFLGVIIFLAHCSFFHRVAPGERRVYVIAYGVIALINLAIQMLFRRNFFPLSNISQAQWPFLCIEALVIQIGIVAVFYRRRPAPQQTAQQARNTAIDQTITPRGILRSIWPFSRLFPPRAPQIADDDDDDATGPLGNPDPGEP